MRRVLYSKFHQGRWQICLAGKKDMVLSKDLHCVILYDYTFCAGTFGISRWGLWCRRWAIANSGSEGSACVWQHEGCRAGSALYGKCVRQVGMWLSKCRRALRQLRAAFLRSFPLLLIVIIALSGDCSARIASSDLDGRSALCGGTGRTAFRLGR